MASLTQWTWVWVSSGSWWWPGKPGVLQSMGLQRVGHNWATELNWSEIQKGFIFSFCIQMYPLKHFPGGSTVWNSPAVQETWIQSQGQEDPLEKEMATHSNILAWRISRTEEPDGLQSIGLQRVGHNWSNLAHREWSVCVWVYFWIIFCSTDIIVNLCQCNSVLISEVL